ncbi:PSME3-interacting protein-like [Ptychodera flava]|uniref:PSME3-interacting protein-like n=1 Tax=Ptychodera flava TaxID=63121 RepID=UPI003969FB88
MSFKSFVSETEVEEKRKKRQEEWEKVRTADQPEECPEEEYDPRSLYEQLQEQKDKKQEEYDEKFKFKNMIYKGLDDDESKFLDHVSQQQMQIEKRRLSEEEAILQEYKESVTSVIDVKERLPSASKPGDRKPITSGNRKSQMALLAGAVKRKRSSSEESPDKKSKLSDGSTVQKTDTPETPPPQDDKKSEQSENVSQDNDMAKSSGLSGNPRASVIGILPGLGEYSESSDSDSSSSDSEVVMLSNVVPGLKKE